MLENDVEESRLILAAEDCDLETFNKLHKFSNYDNNIIKSLIAHGPVLIRGGRGSGKSALLIEAYNRIKKSPSKNILSVYLSLRYLPLLRNSGEAYEKIFCQRLAEKVNESLAEEQLKELDISINPTVGELQQVLVKLSGLLKKRIVLFFDDAAHIGRETSLTEFFDIFRTLSSSTIACKAAIYPGVTKFGTRFDVYNDATVIDITRNERMPDFGSFFREVIEARYPSLLQKTSESLRKENSLPHFLGRAIVGNMRALVFACNQLNDLTGKDQAITLDTLAKSIINLASDYYWPLLEELAPKLGIYEPLITLSQDLADKLFVYATKDRDASNVVASVLIHRDLVEKYIKLFEILEYTGFISRREVSRGMKSGGRGSRYILNLCNLLEKTSGKRLTNSLFETWLKSSSDDYLEIHKNSPVLDIKLPELPIEREPAILKMEIKHLKVSKIYPYGLTEQKIELLSKEGFTTIENLATAKDEELNKLHGIADGWLQRIRNVVAQAVWM